MEKEQKIKGFGLIGILIAVAVIALIGGGGLYVREMQNQKSIEQMGMEKLKEAEALKQKIEEQDKQVQAVLGEEHRQADIIFGSEAEKLCGPQPPAICRPRHALGCRIADKRWDCYPIDNGVDTSTWKTYRNEKYGFEVKYPQNFLTQEGSARDWILIKSAENVDMYLQIQSLNQSPVPFGRYTPWGAHFVGYVTLGNKQAEKYHTDHAIGEIGRNNGNPLTDYVLVLGPKKYIEFQYFGSGDTAVLFENILSTFKFIK